MFTGGFTGRKNYGPDYAIAGKDGVHPGWAGQTVMAYAFLKSLGVDGDIETITVDLKSGAAKNSTGHEVLSGKTGEWQIKSSRYPYCAIGSLTNDNSIRSAMTLIPFNQDLNRLMLVAKGGKASGYKVTWGEETKTYSSAQLAKGVNLAPILRSTHSPRPLRKLMPLSVRNRITRRPRSKAFSTVPKARLTWKPP